MVEFALVLPLLLMVIFLSLGVSSVYAVRNAAHKMTYDAARHVAKYDQARLDGCHTAAPAADSDAAREVVKYYTSDTTGDQLIRLMTGNIQVDAVTTGPPVPGGSQGPEYYCNQAIEVTISYDLNVPAWDAARGLFGGKNGGRLAERALAARLVKEYETVGCKDTYPPKC